jgi:hypothetical protein
MPRFIGDETRAVDRALLFCAARGHTDLEHQQTEAARLSGGCTSLLQLQIQCSQTPRATRCVLVLVGKRCVAPRRRKQNRACLARGDTSNVAKWASKGRRAGKSNRAREGHPLEKRLAVSSVSSVSLNFLARKSSVSCLVSLAVRCQRG